MGANGRKRRHRRRQSSWRSTVVLIIAAVVVLAAGYILMERWESSRYQETRGVVSADFYEKKEISVNGKSYVLKSDLKSVLVMGVDHPDETQEKAKETSEEISKSNKKTDETTKLYHSFVGLWCG